MRITTIRRRLTALTALPLAAALLAPVAAAADASSASDAELAAALPASAAQFKTGENTYRIGAPKAGGSSTGTVPAGLESFYSQKIEFSKANCEAMGKEATRAVCGYAIVPVDYSKPNGATIAVAVVKVPAKGTNASPVFFNPGGPGGSGVDLVMAYQNASGAIGKLNETHDLIGFDPRGVGVSLPFAQCETNAERDKARELLYTGTPEEIAKKLRAGTENSVNGCFNNTGRIFGFDAEGRKDLLYHLGTSTAVRDIDTLRSIMGATKLDYVGYSYGTRLGYVYLQTFPANAGHIVLDGVVDPLSNTAPKSGQRVDSSKITDAQLEAANSALLGQAKGFQDNFNQFSDWCMKLDASGQTWGDLMPRLVKGSRFETEKATCALGKAKYQPHDGDLADDDASIPVATRAFQNMMRPLTTKAIPAGNDGRTLNFDLALTGMRQALYAESYWPYAALAMELVSDYNNGSLFMSLADSYDGRNADGTYDPSQAAFTVIRCADSANPNGYDQSLSDRLTQIYLKYSPFQDPGAPGNKVGSPDSCDLWKFSGNLQAGGELKGLPNTLIISTTHDPATPYENGPVMAELVHGTLLSVEGDSHTAFGNNAAKYACVNEITLKYINEGVVPEDGKYPQICTIKSYKQTVNPDNPVNPVPTPNPTPNPTAAPTSGPTSGPTAVPLPTMAPSALPTAAPTTGKTVVAAPGNGGKKPLAHTGVSSVAIVSFLLASLGGVAVLRSRRKEA